MWRNELFVTSNNNQTDEIAELEEVRWGDEYVSTDDLEKEGIQARMND